MMEDGGLAGCVGRVFGTPRGKGYVYMRRKFDVALGMYYSGHV